MQLGKSSATQIASSFQTFRICFIVVDSWVLNIYKVPSTLLIKFLNSAHASQSLNLNDSAFQFMIDEKKGTIFPKLLVSSNRICFSNKYNYVPDICSCSCINMNYMNLLIYWIFDRVVLMIETRNFVVVAHSIICTLHLQLAMYHCNKLLI